MEICIYNDSVNCKEKECEHCGFNPQEEERRKLLLELEHGKWRDMDENQA